MKYIDIDHWDRKDHFLFFSGMDYPHFNVCADVVLTATRDYIKERNLSLFTSILYAITHVANRIEAFRLRIRGKQVVMHEAVHPSFTVLTADQLFGFALVEYTVDAPRFFEATEKVIHGARKDSTLKDDAGRDDFLFISSLPWVKFNSVSHPIHMHPADSFPRITWGKVTESGADVIVPVSVQVHHALADGVHIGAFFESLDEAFAHPGRLLPDG
ncbi:MAG: chloramphenicol acetyltransferase [Desulfobacterales bacterium]|nr:chloramphenicol acetyltransferase [Desulfobacterales bacterium]